MITSLLDYISYKMIPLSEKDYRASSITMFTPSMALTASIGTIWGRGLPNFLPLAQTGLLDSIWLLDHLWQ
jgi:hypothetical protein